jgi:lipopolysaccharide transport system permease protein
VVFPLETLPVMIVCTAVFHFLIGFLLLSIFNIVAHQTFYLTSLLFPIVVFPLVLLALGMSWILASVGVYVRDIGHVTGILATMLLFLCPIFYPIERVPEELQWLLYFNPLTLIVEQLRRVVIYGLWPDWTPLLLYYVVAVAFLRAGYKWFERTRAGFADVL